MQIEIHKGQVDLSGEPILHDVNLNITTNSRIGLVGRNGSGKTTLLRLLCGELSLANVENDGGFMAVSGNPVIGALNQMTFRDDSLTLVEEIRSAYDYILNLKSDMQDAESQMNESPTEENIRLYTDLLETFTREGGFYFEKEYEAAIKNLALPTSKSIVL